VPLGRKRGCAAARGPQGAPAFTPHSAQDILARLDGGRLAAGHLTSVPAGQYAAAWMETRGWRAALEPVLAQVANVRLALALVARGDAPLGLIYRSDALADARVAVLYEPPQTEVPPIRYPAALTPRAGAQARGVMAALGAARPVFEAHGFTAVPQSDPEACK